MSTPAYDWCKIMTVTSGTSGSTSASCLWLQTPLIIYRALKFAVLFYVVDAHQDVTHRRCCENYSMKCWSQCTVRSLRFRLQQKPVCHDWHLFWNVVKLGGFGDKLYILRSLFETILLIVCVYFLMYVFFLLLFNVCCNQESKFTKCSEYCWILKNCSSWRTFCLHVMKLLRPLDTLRYQFIMCWNT